MLQALLWDVDGTLAETERDGHRVAFNRAFQALGLPWHWDEARYGELLRVTGGRERILADMTTRADAPVVPTQRDTLARQLHRLKNEYYIAAVESGAIALRPGVRTIVEAAAERGWRQAIATTTSRVNVEALLSRHFGAGWQRAFTAVVCGEDVAQKKPAPEVYRRALDALRLKPQQTLAIEDSSAGAAAAFAAEVRVVVTRSAYFDADTFDGAVAVGPGLHTRRGWLPALPGHEGPVSLDDLACWHVGCAAGA